MFGCLGRLGCLVLLVIVGAVAWFTQDEWLPRVRSRFGAAAPRAVAAVHWEPLTPAGAARGRAALEQLSQRNGPVYVNVAAGDIAAVVLDSAFRRFGADSGVAEARAGDERLSLRAHVSVGDLGGSGTLGPLAGVLSGKQEMTVRGRLEVLRPGHAQFRVDEIRIGDLKLPSAVIPKLIARVTPSRRDTTVAADAIPLRVPRELADVRISRGRVTLYKSVP